MNTADIETIAEGRAAERKLDMLDKKLLKLLSDGLPICEEPYLWLAEKLDVGQDDIFRRMDRLRQQQLIKRVGFVVNHHQVGYRANGMVVWNFKDDEVDTWGAILGREKAVTLCYRRPRRLPDWPYNLFTMIHGTSREQVLEKLNDIIAQHHLSSIPHEVLFSLRQFKQNGARLAG